MCILLHPFLNIMQLLIAKGGLLQFLVLAAQTAERIGHESRLYETGQRPTHIFTTLLSLEGV